MIRITCEIQGHELMLTKEEFQASAKCFMEYPHADLYNKRLSVASSDWFIQFSLDKGQFRIDATIALSPIYGVPQIFFRVLHNDILFFDLEKVTEMLHRMKTSGVDSFAHAIGLDQDPFDDFASFFVHPCKTEQVMEEMKLLKKPHYLISFWNLYHL
jgi:Autophagocytosis associated protein, active-site domain